ncbi:hypothetical protein HDV00_000533 [Rhizophlyctis rosea]|nr:hypothetical protein HDV00_000533 [Rhizophlyctis rosea]
MFRSGPTVIKHLAQPLSRSVAVTSTRATATATPAMLHAQPAAVVVRQFHGTKPSLAAKEEPIVTFEELTNLVEGKVKKVGLELHNKN